MRIVFLALLTTAALDQAAVAQVATSRPARRVCRGCDTTNADSVRIIGNVIFVRDLEQLARQVIEKQQLQSTLERRIQEMQSRAEAMAADAERHPQVIMLQRQLATETRVFNPLRNRLSLACKRAPKPTGWMGVAFSTYDPEIDDDGVEFFRFDDYPTIESVEPGGPADEAGIASGDVLLTLDGRDLRHQKIVFSTLLKPGARLPFRVRRGNRTFAATMTIRRRPEQFESACPFLDQRLAPAIAAFDAPIFRVPRPPQPPQVSVRVRTPEPPDPVEAPPVATVVTPLPPSPPTIRSGTFYYSSAPIAGAAVISLEDSDLRDALGADRGLLVIRVYPSTPAERAGLRGGDVVIEVDGHAITSTRALRNAMAAADDHEVELRVIRKKKPLDLTVKWP
jgi:hypothetical protein